MLAIAHEAGNPDGDPTVRYTRPRNLGPGRPHDTVRQSAPGFPRTAEIDPDAVAADSPEPTTSEEVFALTDAARDRVGQLVDGRYRLESLVGAGSSGAVYAALDLETQREVAIKLVHETLRTSSEQIARFRREARATARVGHPSVVTVFDVGRAEDDSLYMVMELLRGEALFHALVEQTIDDDDILEVGIQLLDALGAAHRAGIVHRDVKPENIFLTRDASGAIQVKLIDFGIAKYLRPELFRSCFQTAQGLILGTPHYMSPELCLAHPVDESVDVWATTATLFHAFAGVPPFDDENIGRLLTKIVNGRAPSLGSFRPDLPRALVEVIDRGLRREKDARWANAEELAQALDESVRDDMASAWG